MEIAIDRFGRIVIPKLVREELHLTAGTMLELEQRDSEIVLRAREEKPSLIRKAGFLVFTGEPTGDLRSLVEDDRRARDRKNLAWGER